MKNNVSDNNLPFIEEEDFNKNNFLSNKNEVKMEIKDSNSEDLVKPYVIKVIKKSLLYSLVGFGLFIALYALYRCIYLISIF